MTAGNSCGTSVSSQTINITPSNAANNTGYTGNTNASKTSGSINVNENGNGLRGFVKFSLVAIPVGSTIISSTLNLTNNGSATGSSATNWVKQLNVDPVTTAGAALYNAIGDQGTGVVYNASTWSPTGTISLALSASAISDIQSDIGGSIAMGLTRGGTANYIFDGFAGANPPVLRITYSSSGGNLPVTVSPGAPAAPAASTANGIGCTQFNARWAASTNATTYFLDVSTVNTFATFVTGYNNLNVGNVASSAVTGLAAGTTYYYRIRASNSCGISASSGTVTTATSFFTRCSRNYNRPSNAMRKSGRSNL